MDVETLAVGRSKNCDLRKIFSCDWVIYDIYCKFRGIYFRDGQMWKVYRGENNYEIIHIKGMSLLN